MELETDERLRIVHDFFRVGEETAYHFNIKETRKKGHDFKDYVCPDTMEFEKDYFKMGNRYGRVLFLREYASYIKDSMVAELTDLNRNLMMSIDIVPVPTDEAVREAESRLLGVETNITNWQRKQNQNNNFSATVPYDMEQQKKEMKEFLDDLTTRDQRMMFAVLTMVHTADSKEQLDNDTEALLTTARKHLCQFAVLKYQQMDGLNTAMPFGTRKIDAFRTLTTESLAVFIPFRVQDIYHENGIYYGQNVISKNMIIADRRQLLNGNSFILGVSGGGKSFAAKGEIENIILSSNKIHFDYPWLSAAVPLVVLMIVLPLANPRFLTVSNLTSVLLQAAVYVIMALGMSFVLMTGGIDLSQGSLLALTGVVAAYIVENQGSVLLAILASILVGALVGVVNGSVISRLSIPPFIMTLSTMYLCRGLTLVITQASPISISSDTFRWIGSGDFLGIPVPVIIFVTAAIIGQFILSYTATGRYILAVGSNREAARLSGRFVRNDDKPGIIIGIIVDIGGKNLQPIHFRSLLTSHRRQMLILLFPHCFCTFRCAEIRH